jgi:hypothetical protein
MPPVPVTFRCAGIGFLGHPAPAGAMRLPHGRPTESVSDPIGVATLPAREIRPAGFGFPYAAQVIQVTARPATCGPGGGER